MIRSGFPAARSAWENERMRSIDEAEAMNERANQDSTGAMREGRNDPKLRTEEERIFFDEVSDEQLEAAASGPIITFTLSVVLFACQFCH